MRQSLKCMPRESQYDVPDDLQSSIFEVIVKRRVRFELVVNTHPRMLTHPTEVSEIERPDVVTGDGISIELIVSSVYLTSGRESHVAN